MDQDQNNNNLFDNAPPPPPSGSEEPTFVSGSAQIYDTPQAYQTPPEPVYQAPAGPTFTPPPPYAPAGPPPAQKSNRTWLIILIVALVLCCCCLAFLAFMYFVAGDWFLNELSMNTLLPALAMLS